MRAEGRPGPPRAALAGPRSAWQGNGRHLASVGIFRFGKPPHLLGCSAPCRRGRRLKIKGLPTLGAGRTRSLPTHLWVPGVLLPKGGTSGQFTSVLSQAHAGCRG